MNASQAWEGKKGMSVPWDVIILIVFLLLSKCRHWKQHSTQKIGLIGQ